jgi:hypothetical protein
MPQLIFPLVLLITHLDNLPITFQYGLFYRLLRSFYFPTFDYQLKRGRKEYYDTILAIHKQRAPAAQIDKFPSTKKY